MTRLNFRRSLISFLLILFFSFLMSTNSWAEGRIAGLQVIRNGSVYEVHVDPDGFSLPLVIKIDWGDGQSKTTTWGSKGGHPRLETWYVHEHRYNITRQTRVTITVTIYGVGNEGTATRSTTAIIAP